METKKNNFEAKNLMQITVGNVQLYNFGERWSKRSCLVSKESFKHYLKDHFLISGSDLQLKL